MSKISTICIWGFVIRIVALFFVVSFSDDLTKGFVSSSLVNDDIRYIEGAKLYAAHSDQLFNFKVFVDSYELQGVYYGESSFKLWCWLLCVGMYLFHSEFLLRILNIIFAVISIKCIYDISKSLYSNKVALLASKLYAFFPYPVLFSCFFYKDQFYTMLLLLIFRTVILDAGRFKFKHFLYLTILLILSDMVRSGLVVLIIALLIMLYYSLSKIKLSKSKLSVIVLLGLIGLFYYAITSMDVIEVKLNAYILETEIPQTGVLSYGVIKDFSQVYRYPLALVITMILPLSISINVTSWMTLVGLLNIVMIPIAIGNLVYLFNYKKSKDTFFWCIQVLLLLTTVTSLGIFRHSYYLQPYIMIFFACYVSSFRQKYKVKANLNI